MSAQDAPQYRISVTDDLRSLSVEACFGRDPPGAITAGDRVARRYIDALRWTDKKNAAPRPRRQRIALGAAAAGRCLVYHVDVGAAADDGALRRSGWVGQDLLTTPEIWLWRAAAPLVIEFALPPGIRVSAPWQALESGKNGPRFRAGLAPVHWASQVAIGRFEVVPIVVPGATLRLAVVNGDAFGSSKSMQQWISEAGHAVASVYGRFPRQNTQILVVPSNRGDNAVQWGQVLRGGRPAAHFFVDPARPLSEFRSDWTASHELSHLLLPFVRRSDAWVSEGFASYYQNVARARTGMLSHEQAWEKLEQGYQRGIAGTRRHRSLRAASRRMHQNGDYMRVYWSGAAIALLADVELRRRSNNRVSLAVALQRLGRCCMDPGRRWSARELFAKLDDLTDRHVFGDLLDTHIDATRFPDIATVLIKLGVHTTADGTTLDDDAPFAAIRRAIMTL